MTLSTVGELYDVAINDVGYILADNGETSQARYQRATQVLDPPRFASGATPFTESVERYSFHQFLSGRAGAGQRFYEHPNSDPERFFESENVDSFSDEFGHTVWPDWVSNSTPSWTLPNGYSNLVETTSGTIIATGTSQVSVWGGSSVALTLSGSVYELASDGVQWFAASTSNDIAYGTGASQTGSLSPPAAIKGISHVSGRLAGWYASSGKWKWTTMDDTTGTEEVSGGRLTNVAATFIGRSVEASGYVFTCASTYQGTTLYAWPAGTSDTPFVALRLPDVYSASGNLFVYQGVLYLVTTKTGAGTEQLWRLAVSADGTLTPFLTIDDVNLSGSANIYWAADGDVVFMAAQNGLYQVNVASGGWQFLSPVPSGTSPQCRGFSIRMLSSPTIVVADGATETVYTKATFNGETGTLVLSDIDKAALRQKRYDRVVLRFDPLPAGCAVAVDYSVDGGSSWVSPSGNSTDVDGDSELSVDLGVEARSMRFRVSLTAGSVANTPRLTGVETQVHAVANADTILQLPVRCADRIQVRNGQQDPNDGPGRGAQMVRDLEALCGTAVEVQDVDWSSGAGETFEITGVVLVDRLSVLSSRDGRVRDSQVAVVQCRKTG